MIVRGEDIDEAVAIVAAFAGAVRSTADWSSREAARMRYRAGELAARAHEHLRARTLATAMRATLAAATAAGMNISEAGLIRAALDGLAPQSELAKAVWRAAKRLLVAEESSILAGIEFRSREEAEAHRQRLGLVFETLIVEATDAREAGAYRALVELRGAVVRDLIERGRPLPRLVPYNMHAVLPSLVIANRLYGDAGRAGEIRAENRIRHPAFCPPTGRALTL